VRLYLILIVEMSAEPVIWYSFDTEYSACSVEACFSSTWGSVLATGTYQVNKVISGSQSVLENCESETADDESSPKTERLGRIYLHIITVSTGNSVVCEKVDSVDCPAVLDMKWSAEESNPKLAVADSKGFLSLYNLSSEKCKLVKYANSSVSTGLALALEWSVNNDVLVVSDSKGCVTILHVGDEGVVVSEVITGHGFEAWTCCFSKQDPNLFYSGGDDCVLNAYDLRVSSDSPVKKNSKIHTMGVTSMLSNNQSSCDREWELWTGSYDETVRLWDTRNLKFEVSSKNVGGGVWRIKQRKDRLLIGAMHDGFKIIAGQDILTKYSEHESLAYGADWVKGIELSVGSSFHNLIATCSFYDHLLTVWSVESE